MRVQISRVDTGEVLVEGKVSPLRAMGQVHRACEMAPGVDLCVEIFSNDGRLLSSDRVTPP